MANSAGNLPENALPMLGDLDQVGVRADVEEEHASITGLDRFLAPQAGRSYGRRDLGTVVADP